jgi:2-polyprenyl-3-methyl-5-hydroxy-6-metoxy-1,4-benzoquinol methylase
VRAGAASRDVHDSAAKEGFASSDGHASDAFVARELGRVDGHLRRLVPLLERRVVRARRILDFGCGTGGTSVALALSQLLPEQVIGVDAGAAALEAAAVRAAGYGLPEARVQFVHVAAGKPLSFRESFDLVIAVSVVEFITDAQGRRNTVGMLRDMVCPGGHLFIATPRRGLRELHSGRFLGDLRRAPGHPWASPPQELAAWADGWTRVPLPIRDRWLTRWQRLLARKPAP